MNKNINPVRKSIILLLTFAIAFMAMITLACDENPCADGTACGITAPHGDVMDNAIDFIERTDPAGNTNNW